MVCTVFSRFSSMMRSWASASFAVATTLVGPVASMRLTSTSVPGAPATEVTLKVFRPTDGSQRSWKPQEESSSASAQHLNHDIDQLSGHHDNFLRFLPRHEFDHRLVAQRSRLDLLAGRV